MRENAGGILAAAALLLTVLAISHGGDSTIRMGQRDREQEYVTIVAEADLGAPGNFGADELTAVLRQKGANVSRTSGTADNRGGTSLLIGIPSRAIRLRELEHSGKISVPPDPESYTFRRVVENGRTVLVVAGSDGRGLMYALLEVARRIIHLQSRVSVTQALAELREETGKPEVAVRGMIQFLHSADLERSWYYDREYWEDYLGMLARDRFNSLNLVFAHQTSYLAPPYPFLFSVEKYPQVKVPRLSELDQKKNLATLQMISRLARMRGIDFIMGIWEHRAWKRGQESMVEGLTDDILVDYARLAVEKLLRLCPDISGIQLRVNAESGIENEQQTVFYRDGVLAGMQAAERPVLLDLRGWGALHPTIDSAIDSGLPMRLSMKYWAEFMGMPYQAAQMLPSYSFADFLRYPRRYPVLYQVWSLGSHRLLPWGSVDWMKRFVPTTHLGDGLGFETCAPLSQKGFGNPPGNWRIYLSAEREYFRWEFQRYWLYYLLYGRLSYSLGTSEDVWLEEFRARFGENGAPEVFAAFQSASQVIPFLVSYRLSNPNMYIWPEKQMGGLLDFYIEVKPADEARIAGLTEYIERRFNGARTAKMMPEEASRRLSVLAEQTERALSRADERVNPAENKEYAANRIDLTILALLARYHARKALAGANLALFYEAGDASALRTAKSNAAAGLQIWERLVRLTEGVFFPKMIFGPRDVGHWKDNLVFVRHDVARLDEVEALLYRYGLFDVGLDFGPKVLPRRSAYEPQYANSYPIERRFRSLEPDMIYTAQRGFGWRDAAGITSSTAPRVPYSSLEGDSLEDLSLPSEVLYRDFLRGTRRSSLLIDLPDGEYRVTAIVANQPELAAGEFQIHAAEAGGTAPRTISYKTAETGDKSMDIRVTGGSLALDFIPEQGKDWLVSGLILTRHAPHIAHVPLLTAAPGSLTNLEATITAPDGVASAELHIRVERERERILPLLPDGSQFTAQLEWPANWAGKEPSYYITALDQTGHTNRRPATGAFTVRIGQDFSPPVIEHSAVGSCQSGQSLRLSFRITDSSLAAARLHYRHLTQTEKYETVDLVRTGDMYEATIPGAYINTSYDLMYWIEAVDRFGNGAFYPDPDRATPYVVVKVRR